MEGDSPKFSSTLVHDHRNRKQPVTPPSIFLDKGSRAVEQKTPTCCIISYRQP